MFWKIIAIISLSLFVIFYSIELYIWSKDRKDRGNYLSNYLKHKKNSERRCRSYNKK